MVDFFIDIRVTYSVVDRPQTESLQQAVPVTGISGSPESQFFLKPLECAVGETVLTHKFLYFPECPIPLLGRDLMSILLSADHFLSRRTTAPPTGPSRPCVAVPYETMGGRKN